MNYKRLCYVAIYLCGDVMVAMEASDLNKAFWKAIKDGNKKKVFRALKLGANVNASDKKGQTALHHAAGVENIVILQRLLCQRRADVNAQDFQGRTPMHEAVFHGRFFNISTLFSAGAELSLKDENGNTAYDNATLLANDANDLASLFYLLKPDDPKVAEEKVLIESELRRQARQRRLSRSPKKTFTP